MQELEKIKCRHSVRISWLYEIYNTQYCIFYYLYTSTNIHPLYEDKVK